MSLVLTTQLLPFDMRICTVPFFSKEGFARVVQSDKDALEPQPQLFEIPF